MTEIDDPQGNSFGARFGRLVRTYRDDLGLSARDLTIKVWNDEGRKSSLSRLENGKVPNPDAKTVQAIAAALDIPPEEIDALRAPPAISGDFGAALYALSRASRDQMEAIATRFGIAGAFAMSDAALRDALEKRAEEFRALQTDLAALRARFPQLDNIIVQAQEKLDQGDTEAVRQMVRNARQVLHDARLREALEQDAALLEIDAAALLLDHKVDEAYAVLSAAADSFAGIDPMEPAQRRILRYFGRLRDYGLHHGGTGLIRSQDL